MPSGVYIRTDRARKNMSDSKKRTHSSPEVKEKLSNARLGKEPWNKGIPQSEEAKKKNSESHKNPSGDTREKMRISHLGKTSPKKGKYYIHLSKQNHWNWRGGITEKKTLIRTSEEYKEWRSWVFGWDNYTCQKCGIKHKNIIAHHIKEVSLYPELVYEVSNGITYCNSCHKLLKNKGGLL